MYKCNINGRKGIIFADNIEHAIAILKDRYYDTKIKYMKVEAL